MGWYIYPQEPGTQYGPCLGGCQHKDCASQRADADAPCPVCGQAIGYGHGVYFSEGPNNSKIITHAACYERAAEQPAPPPKPVETAVKFNYDSIRLGPGQYKVVVKITSPKRKAVIRYIERVGPDWFVLRYRGGNLMATNTTSHKTKGEALRYILGNAQK